MMGLKGEGAIKVWSCEEASAPAVVKLMSWCSSQVKSSLLYCQFCHMYSTYIQRIKIAVLSDPWCIQLKLNTGSRRTNTDKYSLNICTYKLYRYTNEDIVEKKRDR